MRILHTTPRHSTQVFDWLPLAAVVAQRVLVLHGGIGDGAWTLEDLDQLQRPIGHDFMNGTESKVHDLLIQVLWSDPSEGHDDANPGILNMEGVEVKP